MPLPGWALLAVLDLAAAAAAQLRVQCSFVGFADASESHPMAYTAKCSRSSGDPVEVCSQLNLEHCLSNHDGELRPPTDGNKSPGFKGTCASCHVDGEGWKLYCQCKRLNLSINYTSVELGKAYWVQTSLIVRADKIRPDTTYTENIIVVQDGLLTCSGTVGEELSECPVTRLGRPTDRARFEA
ncbi:CVNH domain-containing protein [Hirsutella rhossiliensis]|uniref:CVNH domain-containing protein n=1 Tax=Hirsutella rhossiliensis TaxID=111463 RepID=A0A9P8N1B3_9HYPO|nr:CVNH domain-containing protein [Hirsutella rhossiliensis]KAH0966353.1 CVNH domain-containing protein [Hirsutella rhossiliensis]